MGDGVESCAEEYFGASFEVELGERLRVGHGVESVSAGVGIGALKATIETVEPIGDVVNESLASYFKIRSELAAPFVLVE